MSLDDDLQGVPGAMRMLTDVRQRGFASEVFQEPQTGRNLTLSIDERIQYVCERELKTAVESNDCQTGSIVVMNPTPVRSWPWPTIPTFDPNQPVPAGGERPGALQPRRLGSVRAWFGIQSHHRGGGSGNHPSAPGKHHSLRQRPHHASSAA